MSTSQDPGSLESLFARARRHEARTTPEFDALLERPVRRQRSRRRLGILATASVLATGLAVAVLVASREPGRPSLLDTSLPSPFSSSSSSPLPTRSSSVTVPSTRVDSIVEGTTQSTPVGPVSEEGRDEFVEDLPVVGNFVASDGDGNPTIHGARERDFKAEVAQMAAPEVARAKFVGNRAGFAKTAQPQEEERAPGFNTERYQRIDENAFLTVAENPLSTFSIDVDTASYSVVRRYLNQGQLPPRDAVRIEELLNYFPYAYPAPTEDAPFSVNVEIASCPWSPAHRLARIGLKGEEVRRQSRRGTNLVFLIDVSGSMQTPDKLPLLKTALKLLVEQLGAGDEVAIVVYAGASGLALPPTSGSRKSDILPALEGLEAGGSTNGGEGLRLAYQVAREHLVPGGVNRVILATDGDFNVGVTDHGELLRLVEEQARAGIALTTLGFGMGNYKDDTLEVLADRGNGNHFYIDDEREARKVLVEQIGGTLVTIAKDVKIQVEFNPSVVGAYRLLGYENRMLAKEDFNDDRKDAGEIGSGHDVTALYELVPPGEAAALPKVDALKYQRPSSPAAEGSGESLTVKLRYKEPDGETSRLLSVPVTDGGATIETASDDLRFAAAVAAFGMSLRESAEKGSASLDLSARLAGDALGKDAGGYRRGFLDLLDRARAIAPRR
jgi:Ca-activated chloride channel family protein